MSPRFLLVVECGECGRTLTVAESDDDMEFSVPLCPDCHDRYIPEEAE